LKKQFEKRSISRAILKSNFLQKKHLELLWKICNGGQTCGAELRTYTDVSPLCIWCNSCVDTLKHRYFSCSVIKPVWEEYKKIADNYGPEEDMVLKIDVWKALNSENKKLEALQLLVQVLYMSTLWSIYRAFVQKFEEGIEPNIENLKNKSLYGGITMLSEVLKSQILKAQTTETKGLWKMKGILIRRILEVRRTKTTNSLCRLFNGLT
jgi:hypothetical protein